MTPMVRHEAVPLGGGSAASVTQMTTSNNRPDMPIEVASVTQVTASNIGQKAAVDHKTDVNISYS